MTKSKILRMLERQLNKPTDYHFVCHGGGTVLMVDQWYSGKTFTCSYQGDKNWLTPNCEDCNGLVQEEKTLTHVHIMENYVLKQFAKDIIQELENDS